MPASEQQIPYQSVEAAYASSPLSCLTGLVFWGFTAFLIAIRYADVVIVRGQTTSGQTAATGHWRRDAFVLVAYAAAAWIAAHAIARIIG